MKTRAGPSANAWNLREQLPDNALIYSLHFSERWQNIMTKSSGLAARLELGLKQGKEARWEHPRRGHTQHRYSLAQGTVGRCEDSHTRSIPAVKHLSPNPRTVKCWCDQKQQYNSDLGSEKAGGRFYGQGGRSLTAKLIWTWPEASRSSWNKPSLNFWSAKGQSKQCAS